MKCQCVYPSHVELLSENEDVKECCIGPKYARFSNMVTFGQNSLTVFIVFPKGETIE